MNEEMMKKLLNEMKDELKKAIEETRDDLKSEIGGIHARLSELETENQKMGEDVGELRRENEDLISRLQQMEDYSRRDNLGISGLGKENEETYEDLVEKVKELGTSLGVPINDYDIAACHRLPTNRNEETSSTIVRFNSRHKRTNLIRRSKKCRIDEIYISPHLSKGTVEVHKEARQGEKEGKWKFVWVNL